MKTVKEIMTEDYRMENIQLFGNKLGGWMYGDDECFDSIGFYQFFVTYEISGVMVYRLYYDTSDSALDEIDYDHPIGARWSREWRVCDKALDQLTDWSDYYSADDFEEA